MKSIKLFLAVAAAMVVCSGSVLADASCGSKKEHKCCAEAKKAGKACEKCAPKDEAKKDEAKK